MIRLEAGHAPSGAWTFSCYALAAGAGLALTSMLVATAGFDVTEVLASLVKGSVGSRRAVLASIGYATPILLTGLATVLAFRARIWTIGQEGQVFCGAILAYAASLAVAGWPDGAAIAVILAAGALGGSLLGLFSGWLSVRLGVNIIVSTVMLNYCAIFLLSYLLEGGAWGESGQTANYQQTPPIPEPMHLPILFGSAKVHLGLLIALAVAALMQLLLQRTPLGFEIRALGYNPIALRFRGTDIGRTVLVVMAISGAVCGLAGVGEIFGTSHRLRAETLMGLGYTGIIVGMIGRLSPWGTVLAALFFGALVGGSIYMKVIAGVPSALAYAMQGIFLICFICAEVAAKYRLVGVRAHGR